MAEYPRTEVKTTTEVVVTAAKPHTFEAGDFVILKTEMRKWPNRVAMLTKGGMHSEYIALIPSQRRWAEIVENYNWYILRHATISEVAFALTRRGNPDTI